MLLKVITVLCLLQAEASSINMMESLSEEGSCSKYDSRGVLWTGEYGMYTKKSCSLTLGPFYAGSSVEIEKEAFWFCDETLGDFDSPEPDRSGCTDPWIDNLNDNMLSSLSTGEISRIISDGFLLESPAFGVPEDSLWKLGDFLPVLLEEDITIEEEQADITTDTPTDATTAATTTTTNNYTITINPTDAPTAPQTTTSTTTTTIWPNRTTTIKPATTTVKPTTTTIKPTTSTTTTTTTTAAAGICSEIDSRNKIWHATYDEFAYQNCDFCADPCENQASWFCDRTLGRFNTPEPDRSNCIDPWIANIDEMFNILTAFDISETIHNGLKELTSTPPLGGTILKFEELLPKVLELRRTESNSYNDNDDFTINLVSSINEIFNQSVGWTEISDLKNKSKTVTDYLEALDYTGYLYAIKNNCSNCSSKKEFKFSNIHLTSRTVEFNITESAKECFYFDSDPICITSKKEEEKDDDYDCDVLVATMVRTTNDQEIFPNTLTGMMINERKFGKKLIGITINNKTSKWKNDVTIIFDHQTHSNQATCLFVPRTPTCVFWNITTSSWSTLGCKFDYVSSTLDKAVCVCDHCANFGAMLDWEGNAPANDPTLSKLSISLLSLSCFFLVLTEIILMMQLQRFLG
ncbi:latrophilin-like protein 1 isoform X3 [Eurytemora carolleeae]|uniref:latrophilin-like protein 1 isoform X3 n=1 Tax=Eurytemora carolleeae TaxID=1294199 RepID=UPI000C77B309|nr:latrophilin-like protein 1 isoform X3 [Eurytemora carolleeae]|eukprot:XP_023345204.1 latrophilin-like protein 1 isoform X3 [Eurytemora affinis]